jgi:hypothetical protein
MSDDQFTKLFNYMNKRFDEMSARFEATDQKIDKLYGLLDTVIKNQETEQQERAATNHQLARFERWHHQTADKLGLTLDYQGP